MEQSNILAYHYHDKWLETILACRLETVPAGYSRTTFQQIEAADKRLFMLLAEKTRAGLKSGPNGRPCDQCFEECMNSTEERPPSSPSGKGKGKSKGKNTGGQNMRIPFELLNLGCTGATPQGHRLCFSYNLKKCSSQVQNQRCEKGLHLCAIRGCYKQHPAPDCPAKKKD